MRQGRAAPSLLGHERGLSTVEYIILVVLLAAIAIAAWRLFGSSVNAALTSSGTHLSDTFESAFDEQTASGAASSAASSGPSSSAASGPASGAAVLAASGRNNAASSGSPSAGARANANGTNANSASPNAANHAPASSSAANAAASSSGSAVAILSSDPASAEAASGTSGPGYLERARDYIRESAPVQTVLGVAAGTLQALAPGGFLLPSPWESSQAFETGRGVGQMATGAVQVITGAGLVGGGGAAAAGGVAAAPVSGGTSLVVSAAGGAVVVEGALVAAQGATNVAAGLDTLTHAVAMSGRDPASGPPPGQGAGPAPGGGAVDRVVAGSGGSIRQAVTGINEAKLGQAEAVQAVTRVTQASGRQVGGVVELPGGAKAVTGVLQGANQPIVHIAPNGTAAFGSATVSFGVDASGKLVTTVTNVVLR